MDINQKEIEKFDSYWLDEKHIQTLKEMNNTRCKFITNIMSLKNMHVLDVGCGGGILSESMASYGATVTGIDPSHSAISYAKKTLQTSKSDINYQQCDIGHFHKQNPDTTFNVITCLEVLEHLDHPEKLIEHCTSLLSPQGTIFFSTINRNLKSYLFAILGAEYLAKMLPKGTHEYEKFIKPSELIKTASLFNLTPIDYQGISYDILKNIFYLSSDISVNYIAAFRYH